MGRLLEGQLARTVGKALSPHMLDIILRQRVHQARPLPVLETDHPCKGYDDDVQIATRSLNSVTGSSTVELRRVVVILASTLPVEPEPADHVIVRGKTFDVEEVRTDPARATWTLVLGDEIRFATP